MGAPATAALKILVWVIIKLASYPPKECPIIPGHSWSYEFYCDEEIKEFHTSKNLTYSEKLRDKRWSDKRNIVREKADFKKFRSSSLLL